MRRLTQVNERSGSNGDNTGELNQRESAMDIHFAYVVMVIAGMAAFGVTLFG
jgi:hypothetical protein